MAETFNILAIGDAVGSPACNYLREKLSGVISHFGIDLTIVNGENSADGNGMLPQSAEALIDAGADIITGGNHTFRRREVYNFLDDNRFCVRPANMPSTAPGYGCTVIDTGKARVLVISLLGTVYMEPVESPFTCAERMLETNADKYDIAVIDFHAEATSEKAALARFLDGRVSVVFGTHTHVQTADEQILPKGTGFITDLGMTGVTDSILGVKSEIIIEKFISRMPVRFEQASGEASANGAIFMIDKSSKKCIGVRRISF